MATSDMSNLTVVVLTLNEEKHIERCLSSIFQVSRKVIVVDSYSTDQTIQMANALGARTWQHQFKNHAAQLGWAIEHLPIDTEWVMRVDADEIITPLLADEIRRRLGSALPGVNGFLVPLYVRFRGALIRHGGYPQWQLRIWRHGKGAIEQRWMDESTLMSDGAVERLRGDYIDDNLNTITWWTNKHNGYASREAIELLNKNYGFLPAAASKGSLTMQARYKRWLKENIYSYLPLGLRAFLFFLYRMIFRLGILDGRGGFGFHFLQGYWYRFLVDVKVRDVERRMRTEDIDCVEAIRRELGVNVLE
jgi:glycosyltransferase involved in cell wall biosynthesis